jgi:hypothetical protein
LMFMSVAVLCFLHQYFLKMQFTKFYTGRMIRTHDYFIALCSDAFRNFTRPFLPS